jgi:hypothetical protein
MTKELHPKDWEKIELYMKSGASQKRIAAAFNMSEVSLRAKVEAKYGDSYSSVNQSFATLGEILIEATQFQKALSGNVPMLLWLGKVRCNQREPELVSSIPPNQDEMDKTHTIIQLQHENRELKEKIEKINADKPKTR